MTPAHNSPRLLVEPFAGMAALSFGCMGAKPPISWMGSKRGYTRVLMELLGLSRHNPPAAYIWGDVGPNVAALATLAGARGDARDVAGWLQIAHWAHEAGNTKTGLNATKAYGAEWRDRHGVVGYYPPQTPEKLSIRCESLPLPRAAEVAAIIRGWKDEEPRALWTRLKAAGWPSLMPVEGGRWLGPAPVEEVAGWLWATGHGDFSQPPRLAAPYANPAGNADGSWKAPPRDWLATRCQALPSRWPRVACYQGTATRLVEQLPADLSGVLVYIDGPYHGDGSRKITGYKFGGCSREEQLALVADCHRRGARVAMSESVPLAAELRALTGDEWWPVDITEHREGQARTFGGTSEYVTLNRPPLHTRGAQQGLFGGAR